MPSEVRCQKLTTIIAASGSTKNKAVKMTPGQVRNRISGIPVVEASGKLVGILTNRDVRFADNPAQPVRELMTHENLATVKLGVGQDEARRLLHQRRIEKLLVVDDAFHRIEDAKAKQHRPGKKLA